MQQGLDGQPRPPFEHAPLQNLASAAAKHPGSESVNPSPVSFFWLECSFWHDVPYRHTIILASRNECQFGEEVSWRLKCPVSIALTPHAYSSVQSEPPRLGSQRAGDEVRGEFPRPLPY